MKNKIRTSIIVLFSVVLLSSCFTTRMNPLDRLTIGMSKREVFNIMGFPNRLLEARFVGGDYLEVLEYTVNNDIYAFEFWNDSLTSIVFLSQNHIYVPPRLPPPHFHGRGRPVIIIRPPRNNPSPPPPTRPPLRPPLRPGTSGGRSDNNSGSVTRPNVSGERPSESRPDTSGGRGDSTQGGTSVNPGGSSSSGSGGRYNSGSSGTGSRVESSGSTRSNTDSSTSGSTSSGSSSSGGRSTSSDSGSTRSDSNERSGGR